MNKIAPFLLSLFAFFPGLHAVTNYPFPTHNTYQAGVIKPNNVTQNQMDQIVRDFYDEWKVEYLRTVPGVPNQAYIFYNEDESSEPDNAVSVSEGHGYGMMLAVYMAGHDPDAQTIFDNLFRFYQAYESVITTGLMGWQQIEENGVILPNDDGGDDSATDGDLDIAYALLLADKQWGSGGSIHYLNEANFMISKILEGDVNEERSTLKLGDWVEDEDPKYGEATRTSDFMLNHVRNFAASSGDPAWDLVLDRTYLIINEVFDHYSPTTGLLPDFVEFIDGAYVPAEPDFLEREEDGDYSWNACRTPWRIATDYIMAGDTRALSQLTTLNAWIRTKASDSPYDTKAGYTLEGMPLSKYDDLAFVTPFAVGAMISSTNQTWLNDLWDYTSTQPTANENYFANTIRMLCFLVITGNWWTPLNLPI